MPSITGESDSFQAITLSPAAGDITLPLYRGGDAIRPMRDVNLQYAYKADNQLPTMDVVRRHRMFPRGGGWSQRPGDEEAGEVWDGAAEGQDACFRFGYVCPSGQQFTINVDPTWGGIQKLIGFNGDLWVICLKRIGFIPLGTGGITDYYHNSVGGDDQFTDVTIWNGSLRVAMQCPHAPPGQHFFVTITPTTPGVPSVYNAAVNPTQAAPGATAASATTPQLRLLAKAFWEYAGTSAYRLMAQVSDTQFRYMVTPDADPYDGSAWGPVVRVGESTYQIRRMVSSHDTVWFVKRDGCYAVNDKNAAAGGENLTPYWGDVLDDNDNRINITYWRQWVVASHAFGIDLLDVNSWQVKDQPTQTAIGFGRSNNTNLNGPYTSFCTDNGWLVGSMRTLSTQAVVMYGTYRQRESPTAGVTLIDWFPEIGPLTAGRDITSMTIFTVAATGRPYLYLGMQDGAGLPYLVVVEGFIGTSPLADANHTYQSTWSLTFTDEHHGTREAIKGGVRAGLAVRNCGSGRHADLYLQVGAGVAFGGAPSMSITTNVETQTDDIINFRGSTIRSKVVAVGTVSVPVVVDEMWLRANLAFKTRRRGTWRVEISRLAENSDLPTHADPAETEAALRALVESAEDFLAVDVEDQQIRVILENVLDVNLLETNADDLPAGRRPRVIDVAYQVIDKVS